MATTRRKKKLRRLTLTPYQINLIKSIRDDLGTTIREVYYEDMFDLMLKHREKSQQWTRREMDFAVTQIDGVIYTVDFNRKVIKSLVDNKPLKQLVDPLIEERLASVPDDEMTKRKISSAQKWAISMVVNLPKQYKDRLAESVKYMSAALVHFGRISSTRIDVTDIMGAQLEFMYNFIAGMGALRFAWEKLFYTTQAGDVRQVRLNRDESEEWHKSVDKSGHGPQRFLHEFIKQSYEQGIVIHIYDDLNELLFVVRPPQMLSEQEYAQRAMRGMGKPKVTWEYHKEKAAPGKSFAAHLTESQKQQVSKILKERGQVPIAELSRELGVPYHGMGWQAGYQANPGDEITEMAKLHQAIWSMDLRLPEE